MSKVENEFSYNIKGWMVNELNLKGNELIIYSIIYTHSQGDDNCFSGSLQYLADWCKCAKSTVQNILQKFVDNGLVSKKSITKNNITFCEYRTEQRYGIPSSGTKYSNNITNIDNITNNTNILSEEVEQPFAFGKQKQTKPNLYSQCISIINEFTESKEERDVLVEYLDYRISVKDKPLYANMWKGMISKLDEICKNMNTKEFCAYITDILAKGWLSFYPTDNKSNKSVDNVEGSSYDSEITLATDSNGNAIKF